MVAQSDHAVADDLMADPGRSREPLVLGEPVAVRRDSQIRRAPNSSSLYDVLDLILDKGVVVDAFVRVSLVGIEILTVDLRVVIASVDTYLRYAEGAERLHLYTRAQSKRLPDMVSGAGGGGSGMKGKILKKGAEKVKEKIGGGDGDESEEDQGGQEEGIGHALTRGVRHILKKGVGGILHKVAGTREEDEEREDQGAEDQGEQEESAEEPEASGREREGERGGERRHRGEREGREGKERNPSRAKAGSRR
jgi:gas vesicle structural protein